jgi:hypothetical protein
MEVSGQLQLLVRLYLEKELSGSMDKRVGGTLILLGPCRKKKNLLPMPRVELSYSS